jgi:excisionase family DNA binding protein
MVHTCKCNERGEVMAATLQRTDQIVVAPKVTRQAKDVWHDLDTGTKTPLREDQLGEELQKVLVQVVKALAEGHAVTVTAMPEVLTSTVAAEIIGISRPTLMRHARAGDIPSIKVGSHTRFRREDVLRFKRVKLAKQRQAMEELLALEDELGLI